MKKSSLIFLIFFFLLIFLPVPVFYGFREQIGYKNTENKTLEGFPELNRGNFSTWPKRFEEWLSDTLPFKTQFIELYRGAQFYTGLDFTQSDVIRGKENHLYYRKTVENYKGLTRFSDEELETAKNNIADFFFRMEKTGAKCLLYIAPDKEQVTDQWMPTFIRRISAESGGDRFSTYLHNELDQPVLYPKSELRAASRTLPLYFDTDTHWNELGGWFAAQQIKSAFTGTPASTEAPQFHYYDEEGKDLAGMLGLSERIPEKNAVLIDFSDGLTVSKTQTVSYGTIQRYSSDTQDPEKWKKLMIIGDSFSEYYLRSAIHDVKDILFVKYGNLDLVDLEAEAPDYLVVMLVERNLPFLISGFY